MPRTRSLAWSELKIGVLTIVAVVVTAVLIFSLTGQKGFSWQRYTLKARFPNVAGLASGSPVRVAGVEVGTVTGVQFAGEQVDVLFEVRTTMRPRITDASAATLGSVSLLGESAVDITPATSGTPVPDFGYVKTAPAKGSLTDVADRAQSGIEEITALVKDIRQGKGTVGKLMTDDQLYTNLKEVTSSINAVTDAVKNGRGTIGKLINDPQTANALQASLQNLETMTRKINAGEGSIGKLLNDEAFSQALTGATANLRTVTDRLNRGEGTIGKLMTDPALFNRLNDVTEKLNDLVAKLNAGEGTAGQLLKDKQLYENMNGAVSDLRSLLAAIQKDPRKYLNIKVSIF
ncbi:MAG TPA: MlaD family protein [Vicinamibacterales bacterium]|jgi:phospholipid/cholesterol/gamma-HCH transport system substrate-binding protein